jgi:hypothetical protein
MTRSARALLLALLIITLIAPLAAHAQTGAPVIENAELRLWPEYDDPGLLVIFSGNFAEGTTFPLRAAFPLSEGARNIQATYQDASGTLINRPFEITDGKLTYELPSGAFHYEYYVDREPSGNARQITYVLDAPYAINNLRITAQQPRGATDFALAPAAETTQQGTDGLTYHVVNRANVAAGEKLEIGVSYTKTDTSLSLPQLAVTSTGVAADDAAAAAVVSTSAADWLPWLLIGVGVALLAGILIYWLISRRQPEPEPVAPAPAPRRAAAPSARPLPTVPARPAPPSAPQGAPTGPAAFCHSCGNALKAEDRFCSQCGTPRRS